MSQSYQLTGEVKNRIGIFLLRLYRKFAVVGENRQIQFSAGAVENPAFTELSHCMGVRVPLRSSRDPSTLGNPLTFLIIISSP